MQRWKALNIRVTDIASEYPGLLACWCSPQVVCYACMLVLNLALILIVLIMIQCASTLHADLCQRACRSLRCCLSCLLSVTLKADDGVLLGILFGRPRGAITKSIFWLHHFSRMSWWTNGQLLARAARMFATIRNTSSHQALHCTSIVSLEWQPRNANASLYQCLVGPSALWRQLPPNL